jgi:hypothetical protein
LFVEAVDRWAMHEAAPKDRRRSMPDGPTLFDLANPLELRVETSAARIDPQDDAGMREREAGVYRRTTAIARSRPYR